MERLKLNKKKGSIVDIFFIMIVLFMLGIGFLLFHHVWGSELVPKINNTVQDSNFLNNQNADEFSHALGESQELLSLLDYVFVMIFFGFLIALVILSFRVTTSPVFFIIFIIVLALAIMISVFISNAYQQFALNSLMSGSEASFSMMEFILDNLPYLTFIFGMVMVVIMYVRSRGASEM